MLKQSTAKLKLDDAAFMKSLHHRVRARIDELWCELGSWEAIAESLEKSRVLRERETALLIKFRLDGYRSVACPSCRSLPILYRKSGLRGCPNCRVALLPNSDTRLYKAFPELISE